MNKFLFFVLLLFCISVNAQDVYKTPSGKKYHLASCRMVNNVSEKITIEHAIELGLGPCGICMPGVKAPVSGSQTPRGQDHTVQCKGITKNGTRCRHMTSIANGFCYEHAPK